MTELDQALGEFATHRSSELTRVIELLGRDALADFTPPTAKKNLDFHRAWKATAADARARTWCLDTMIAKLPKLSGGVETSFGEKFEAVIERIQALRAVDPDPRIARAALAWIDLRSPVMNWTDVMTELAHLIIRHADDTTSGAPQLARLGREASEIIERGEFPEAVELDDDIRSRWAAVQAPPTRDPRMLFDAVYAALDSDEPRAILGDTLQDAGDPRGELITLQLAEARGDATPAMKKRIVELVKKHGKDWLGALRPVTYRAELRRGFLARLELGGSWNSDTWDLLRDDPTLATVEELIIGQANTEVYSQFLRGRVGRSVRMVEVQDDDTLNAITATQMPRLRELACMSWKGRPDYEERLRNSIVPLFEARPTLKRFHCRLDTIHAVKKLIPQLTHLYVMCETVAGLPLWSAHAHLEVLRIGWDSEPLELHRNGGDELARIWPGRWSSDITLDRLPPTIKRLEVINNAKKAKVLAREFPEIEVVALPQPSGTITGVK